MAWCFRARVSLHRLTVCHPIPAPSSCPSPSVAAALHAALQNTSLHPSLHATTDVVDDDFVPDGSSGSSGSFGKESSSDRGDDAAPRPGDELERTDWMSALL